MSWLFYHLNSSEDFLHIWYLYPTLLAYKCELYSLKIEDNTDIKTETQNCDFLKKKKKKKKFSNGFDQISFIDKVCCLKW
jgi:hypothetical protein